MCRSTGAINDVYAHAAHSNTSRQNIRQRQRAMSSKKRGAPEERISDKAKQAKSNQEPEEEEEEIVDTPPAPSPEEDEAAHLLRILRAGGDKGSLLRRIKEFTNGLQDAKEEDAMIITMRFLNRGCFSSPIVILFSPSCCWSWHWTHHSTQEPQFLVRFDQDHLSLNSLCPVKMPRCRTYFVI